MNSIYSEYIDKINKIEDFFVERDGKKVVEEISPEDDYHKRFEKRVFGYISSALNSQQTLLARNRALFLAIDLGLVGLSTKIIYDYSIDVSGSHLAFQTGIYILILSVMGLICSHLWGVTTQYRRHKVWFLESLLVCLEEGYVLDQRVGGPIKMINFIEDKDKIRLLKQGDSVSSTIVNCSARYVFKGLRLGFIFIWGVGVLFSAVEICSLDLFLSNGWLNLAVLSMYILLFVWIIYTFLVGVYKL